MNTTGLDVFDTTILKTNAWLADLTEHLEIEDRDEAYRVLRAVLHAIRDQLGATENAQLAAQFPMLLRGLYFEGWRPFAGDRARTREEFEELVMAKHGARPYVNASEMMRAVADTMRRHIEPHEVDKALHCLTEPVQDLFSGSTVLV